MPTVLSRLAPTSSFKSIDEIEAYIRSIPGYADAKILCFFEEETYHRLAETGPNIQRGTETLRHPSNGQPLTIWFTVETAEVPEQPRSESDEWKD